MNSRVSLAVLLFAVSSALFIGCASTPFPGTIPERMSADDTLVLLPVYIKNKTATISPREYDYVFSGNYGTRRLPQASGYIVLVVHESGVVLEKVKTYVVDGQGFYGAPAEWDVNLPLPYKPGKMVVAPFTFTRIFKPHGGDNASDTDIAKASEEQIQKILKHASKQKNAGTWDK